MPVLIAVPGSEDHAHGLGARLGLPVLVPEYRQFPDGELYLRLDGDVGDHAVLVGNARGESFLPIAFLAGTARDLGARRVGLVAPYLGYMRQDSRFAPGESVTATYFGRLMSSTVDWLVTVDPHLHRLASLDAVYSIPTTIARAAPAIATWITERVHRPVLVGPDAESAQWVTAVAERCGAPCVILEKTRRGDRDVSVSSPGDAPGASSWSGHTPVVIDDIVSTGRTLIEATRQLRAAGAAAPMCVAIHAVFSDTVVDALAAAGAAGIVTCNTIAHATNQICVLDRLVDAMRARLAS